MKRDPLGNNPLSKGIFSRTDTTEDKPAKAEPEVLPIQEESETRNQKPETRNHNLVSGFPSDRSRIKITVQLLEELNEWLDGLVKSSRKNHGHKIQKQIWIEAAIELLKNAPVDWETIQTAEQLSEKITQLSNQLKTINHKP